jgi:hypothetical protein
MRDATSRARAMMVRMSEPTTDAPVLIVFAPCLPLLERLDVNGWQLVPHVTLTKATRLAY